MANDHDRHVPFPSFMQGLPEDQQDRFLDWLSPIIERSVMGSLPDALKQYSKKFGFPDEIIGLLQLLAAKSNDSKEEVVRKALTLYGLAIDAREKGNRMAILSPDNEILHEIEGFESGERPAQSALVSGSR